MHLAHARNEERQMPRVLGCTGLRSLPLISAIMYVCASPRRMHHNFWYLRPISPGSTVLWDRTWGWGEQWSKIHSVPKKLTDFIKNDKLNKLKPFLMNSVSYFFEAPCMPEVQTKMLLLLPQKYYSIKPKIVLNQWKKNYWHIRHNT